MDNLEVKRIDRVVTLIINGLVMWTFLGVFVNWYLYATSGRTVGSIVMGFATLNPDGTPPGIGGSIVYYFANVLQGLIIGFTFGIMFIYMIATMEKRNGNFAEAWTGQRKVPNGGSAAGAAPSGGVQ